MSAKAGSRVVPRIVFDPSRSCRDGFYFFAAALCAVAVPPCRRIAVMRCLCRRSACRGAGLSHRVAATPLCRTAGLSCCSTAVPPCRCTRRAVRTSLEILSAGLSPAHRVNKLIIPKEKI